MSEEQTGLNGLKKAALLMLTLGEDAAAEVMRRLSPQEAEKVASEIASLGTVEREAAGSVLKEFVAHGNTPVRGGKDQARRIMERSLGAEKSRRLMEKISGDVTTPRLASFGEIDPEHLAKFIQDEHPQTVALIVAHLEPGQAAKVFHQLPDDLRGEVSVRMAGLEEISPEVLERIAEVLQKKLSALADFSRETYGGVRAVAELLNRLDRTMSKEVLDDLEAKNPDVALSVRNLMFVFEDIVMLDDKAIRDVMQQVDKKTLAVALKGATQELQDLFFRNMSQRAGENLREEMDLMGPVKLKDVEAAQKEIVTTVRNLEEEGVITISSGADEYVI